MPFPGEKVFFCGGDGETYNTTGIRISLFFSQIKFSGITSLCYSFGCNISTLYPGTCACPNSCSSLVAQGACLGGQCVCAEGWTGPDCASVKCPSQSCSSQGACVAGSDTIPDTCKCNPDRTGIACDTVIDPKISAVPYGVLATAEPYYRKDDYGDDHPIFNVSVLGNIKIRMNHSDFLTMLYPLNLWQQEYLNASFHFDNGHVSEYLGTVGFRLKGYIGSKLTPKKAYKIKFNVEKGVKFHGAKKLGLKSAVDVTHMNDMLGQSWNRAMMVQTYRGSFTSLFINDIYFGLFWMHEELDDEFLKSRYDSTKGNLYKCNTACLNYLGTNPEIYKNLTLAWPEDSPGLPSIPLYPQNSYSQEEGDGNFSDLVNLITILNITDDLEFKQELEKIFDLEMFLRAMVVENFFIFQDGYSLNCNNYLLYHDPKTQKWNYISHDVALSFWMYVLPSASPSSFRPAL